MVDLDIYLVNDFHGALLETEKNPGAAKLAGFLQEKRAAAESLILAGGDMFQDTPDSALLYGKPVVEVMNKIGFDAMVIGNHEFDWGVEKLEKRVEESHFPYLAANIRESSTGCIPSFAKPYLIVEKKGIKVGIIGLITPETAHLVNPDIIDRFIFLNPRQVVAELVPQLRNQGVEIIVLLAHLDSYINDSNRISGDVVPLLQDIKGVDAVCTAHSHKAVTGKVNGIPIVQASCGGRAVGIIRLSYSFSEKKVKKSQTEIVFLNDRETRVCPKVQDIIERVQLEVGPIKNRFLGKTVYPLIHQKDKLLSLGKWVTDLMRKETKGDIAFQSGGSLRGSIEAGDVTLGSIYEVMPYDSILYLLEMTGQQILETLEYGLNNRKVGMVQFSGIKVKYRAENKILEVTLLDGSHLDPKKSYQVVTNDYLLCGGDQYTMFQEGANFRNTSKSLRNLLMESLRTTGVLEYFEDERLIKVPEASPVKLSPAA